MKMTTIKFVTTTGAKAQMQTFISERMGEGLRALDSFMIGTVFKPATAADRDALVQALQELDYTVNTIEVLLEHDGGVDQGIYRIRATMTVTGDQLDAWIKRERADMAKRLGLKDVSDIKISIKSIKDK